jgi:ABC-type oligopeptide transport system ATPase subunit
MNAAKTRNVSAKPERKVSLDELKGLASGRWQSILTTNGFPAEYLSTVHGPCPKCGGSDRYRAFEDFDQTGGLFCNQCFATRNGDGLASLQWWLGCDFSEAARRVADFLHVELKSKGGREKADPLKNLVLREWHPIPAKLWCRHKPGVAPEAIQQAGGLPARYRERYSVMAFPVRGPKGAAADAVGWVIFEQGGGELPIFDKKSQPPRWEKVKVTAGSDPGLIGDAARLISQPDAIKTIFKVEGVSDCLALMGAIPESERDSTAVITTANGSKEKPEAWMLDAFAATAAGQSGRVVVIHDCDQPGEDGASRWVAQLAMGCQDVRHVRLPYEMSATHGKDLRDWLNEGHTFTELVELANSVEPAERSQAAAEEALQGVTNFERGIKEREGMPLPMQKIVERCFQLTDGWPRRVGEMLFTYEEKQIHRITNQAGLFGYIGQKTGVPPEFWRGASYHTKGEVFERIAQCAPAYESIEYVPHEPLMPNRFYACDETLQPGDGKALDGLLEMMKPASQWDADLLRLMFVTPFWGGAGGTRPVFVLTSDDGRGSGKSSTARMVCRLFGGHIELTSNETFERIKERLLTPESLRYRIVLLDNVKSHKFSWADFEGLVTSPVISGRALYIGEAQRPNTLTYLITMNGPAFSKDLAQRSVIIKVSKPQYAGNWIEMVETYIAEHRRAIYADCVEFLRRERTAITGHSRWGAWEKDVLQRLPEPDEVRRIIAERQSFTDSDADECDLIQSYVQNQLADLRYDTEQHSVFIPAVLFVTWYRAATNDRTGSTVGVMRKINQSIDESEFTNLFRWTNKRKGRGVLWQGDKFHESGTEIFCDLEHRIELESKGGSF